MRCQLAHDPVVPDRRDLPSEGAANLLPTILCRDRSGLQDEISVVCFHISAIAIPWRLRFHGVLTLDHDSYEASELESRGSLAYILVQAKAYALH